MFQVGASGIKKRRRRKWFLKIWPKRYKNCIIVLVSTCISLLLCSVKATNFFHSFAPERLNTTCRPRHSSGGLSPASHRGGPGSNPGLVMWDFVMDKSEFGAGFLRELRFPLPICIPSASPQSYSLSPEAGTIG
jgi:hypothetical protein